MDSDFKSALDPVYDGAKLRKALVQRSGYDFATAEDPETFVALVDGAVPLRITFNNSHFWFDPDDTTTPHDGVTVIRTSDDYCYKVEDIDMRVRSVLSSTTEDPPVSPAVGDSYLIPAGATGAWSSHQDDITTYTPRGWVFEVPIVGRWLLDEEIDGYIRYSATGWLYGPGARSFDDESVPLSASLGWGERVIVENQTTTTPPTATKGLRYIVGTPSDQTSTHSAATAGGNTASASTTLTGFDAWKAFDKIKGSVGGANTWATNAVTTGWLQYQFAVARAIGAYTVTSANGFATRAPSAWTLQGSNTGAFAGEQITLDTRTSQTGWTAGGQTRAYTVASPGSYTYYRLNVTANNGDATYVEIDEVTLSGALSGTWLGKDKQIAICEVPGEWTFYPPSNGWAAFDKSLNASYTFNGTAWVSSAGAFVGMDYVKTDGAGSRSTTADTGALYTYSDTVAPTISNIVGWRDDAGIPYAAKKVGAVLRFRYRARLNWGSASRSSSNSTATTNVAVLFRDSESDAIDWIPIGTRVPDFRPPGIDIGFQITASDTAEHTYKVALSACYIDATSYQNASMSRRLLSVDEGA